MRRKDREITLENELTAILNECRVCRIAMTDGAWPYIVPMNYGYTYENGTLTLFFHCAKAGRKLELLKANPAVAFEMDCAHSLIEGRAACDYSFAYQSVCGTGTAVLLEDWQDKAHALSVIMKTQTGREFTFGREQASGVAAFKIDVREFTGKRHDAPAKK